MALNAPKSMTRDALRDDHRVDFSFLISDVSRLMRKTFDRKMMLLGLTRAQWHTLVHVLRMETPTQTELADVLDINRSSAGGLIDQLEKSGFIRRTADVDDRRVWRISATKLAEDRAKDIAAYAETLADEIFAKIPDQDLEQARQVLLMLQENMNA
jgi:DNA-binding MarR family transcriptional regulator